MDALSSIHSILNSCGNNHPICTTSVVDCLYLGIYRLYTPIIFSLLTYDKQNTGLNTRFCHFQRICRSIPKIVCQESIQLLAQMAASKLATIGILSLGDMGTGIAKLLVAKGFSVATNAKGRR